MKINERFTWALSLLKPKPLDNILEIGCGTGLFGQLICYQLTTGKYVAVDRSAAMVKLASKRADNAVKMGKADFHVAEFKDTSLPHASFNKIVAFNVNVFFKDPKDEMNLIKACLKADGLFYLFYQHPYESNHSIVEKAKQPLVENGFVIIDAVLQKMKPFSSFCVISKPV